MPTISLDTQQRLAGLWTAANVWLVRANGFDRSWKAPGSRALARTRARAGLEAYFDALENIVEQN